MTTLSHLDAQGNARMVDVSAKADTTRTALAAGEVRMKPETLALIRAGALKKGDVLTVAQLAGVLAAKRTSDLIPLCHPLPLTHIEVQCTLDDDLPGVHITASARTTGKTGVEMEALTAVSVAALTIYDMAKAAEHTLRLTNIRLLEKHGGKHDFVADPTDKALLPAAEPQSDGTLGLTYQVIGLAMAVHNELGPGHRESTYHNAMHQKFVEAGLPAESEPQLPILDGNGNLINHYRPDHRLSHNLLVEYKAHSYPLTEDEIAQCIDYFAASDSKVILLFNFGTTRLTWKRLFPPKKITSHRRIQYPRPSKRR